MPHNVVFVQPGARQEVANAAQNMKPGALDKQGRAFIPKDRAKIIAATKVVEPGQKETLKFTAPTEKGDYEYVCTLPGHFAVMNGKFIVTRNVDAWLQAHLAAAVPVVPKDHTARLRAALAK